MFVLPSDGTRVGAAATGRIFLKFNTGYIYRNVKRTSLLVKIRQEYRSLYIYIVILSTTLLYLNNNIKKTIVELL
jgi:hypothetical protein